MVPEFYSEISKKTRGYLDRAKNEALKSDCRARHGAVLVKGGNIINVSFNENSYCSFGMRFRDSNMGLATHHAELRCILGIDKGKTDGATLYVVRIGCDDNFRMSRPCSMCMRSLIFCGVKRVVYTTNDGIEVIKL